MAWTVRARLSVPPPGPAVAMNSIGLAGRHSAATAWADMSAKALAKSTLGIPAGLAITRLPLGFFILAIRRPSGAPRPLSARPRRPPARAPRSRRRRSRIRPAHRAYARRTAARRAEARRALR